VIDSISSFFLFTRRKYLMLKDNDLKPEDFDNFYSAKNAHDDAYLEKLREKENILARPHIHNIFNLIKNAAQHGMFELEYSSILWRSCDRLDYICFFLKHAGYEIKTHYEYSPIITISWGDETNVIKELYKNNKKTPIS
jgi:hypothetical protein